MLSYSQLLLFAFLQLLLSCQTLQHDLKEPFIYNAHYVNGRSLYFAEKWNETVAYFEGAIQEYNEEMQARLKCYSKCREKPLGAQDDFANYKELQYFHGVLQWSTCVEKCKTAITGRRPLAGVSSRVEIGMKQRNAHNFLQMALYKVDTAHVNENHGVHQ